MVQVPVQSAVAPGERAGPAVLSVTPGPPSQLDLARRQLDAVEAWHRRRRVQEAATETGQRSREQRLDLARQLDVLREQHRAIIASTDAQLRSSAELLRTTARPRALVVHRNAWFADKVATSLRASGVDLIAQLVNGAEAVGTAVAEQPDLLLVEDSLPMLSGEAVVREVRLLAPGTLIVAQVAHDSGVPPMLQAGARAAYVRSVPPADVAAGLLAVLRGDGAPRPDHRQGPARSRV